MIEHVLYASIVWLAAWLLTSMQRGSATTKYWIWVATSLNFLLPLGAIPERLWPLRLGWLAPHVALPSMALTPIVVAVWLLGAIVMLARLGLRIRTELRSGAAGTHSPAVEGLLRLRIVLPHGIDRVLTGDELRAVLVHERTHARRRDNRAHRRHRKRRDRLPGRRRLRPSQAARLRQGTLWSVLALCSSPPSP